MKVWIVWVPDLDPFTAPALVAVCASQEAAERAIRAEISQSKFPEPRSVYSIEEYDVLDYNIETGGADL